MRVQPDGVLFDFIGPGGRRVEWRLRITWTSLLRLHAEWGETYELRMEAAWKQRVLADLAHIVELVGGPPAVEVVEIGPPILSLGEAMQTAWNWVHRGYESAEHFAAALQKEQQELEKEAAKARRKKSALSRLFSSFAMRWRTLSARG